MCVEKSNDDIVLAKDINDCSACPLHKNDCPGGWTSGGGGTPIEPPCCSWNDDKEIYEGMYDNSYEPSEQELNWERERRLEKEHESNLKKEAQYKEEIKTLIHKTSAYGNAKIKSGRGLCDTWFCPKCNRWFHAWHESCHDGITETSCNYCGSTLAHSYILG